MKYQLPLILYDPECPLCLRFKQGLHFLDKNLNFVSAREAEVFDEFPQLSPQACLESVHMITSDLKILKGSEVVDHLLETLPGVSKLGWLLDNDQGKKVKDFFYNKVEELRALASKKDSECPQCPRK